MFANIITFVAIRGFKQTKRYFQLALFFEYLQNIMNEKLKMETVKFHEGKNWEGNPLTFLRVLYLVCFPLPKLVLPYKARVAPPGRDR